MNTQSNISSSSQKLRQVFNRFKQKKSQQHFKFFKTTQLHTCSYTSKFFKKSTALQVFENNPIIDMLLGVMDVQRGWCVLKQTKLQVCAFLISLCSTICLPSQGQVTLIRGSGPPAQFGIPFNIVFISNFNMSSHPHFNPLAHRSARIFCNTIQNNIKCISYHISYFKQCVIYKVE